MRRNRPRCEARTRRGTPWQAQGRGWRLLPSAWWRRHRPDGRGEATHIGVSEGSVARLCPGLRARVAIPHKIALLQEQCRNSAGAPRTHHKG